MRLSLTTKVNIFKTISAIVLIIILSIGSYHNGQVHTSTNPQIENQYSERSET